MYMLTNKSFVKRLLVGFVLILSLFVFSACSSGNNEEENEMNHEMNHEMDHDHEMDHEMDHEHSDEKLPNDGASIEITSPAGGDTFAEGDEITVDVTIDSFELDSDGSHWHVYVDGESWGMVTGGRTSEVLRGVEAGEHEISVFMATGEHIELEEGDSITITVE